MRVAVVARFALSRCAIWRGAVWSVAAGALAVLFAWVMSHANARGLDAAAWPALVALLTGAGVVGSARALGHQAAAALSCDAQGWQLTPVGDGAPLRGDVAAVLDLGHWMLLRFTSAERPLAWLPWRTVRWIPVRRQGLESGWHELRCALHARRGTGALAARDTAS